MHRKLQGIIGVLFIAVALLVPTLAGAEEEYDYTKDKVLHVVGTAHLDTQWRWTIRKTIDEYILNTLRDNFDRFEKYPNYKFSFEGAFRYMLANEYYPDDFARLKEYIRQGRWNVCGSSLDAGDVNIPSPEAIMRNIMYGQLYFKRQFGKSSVDIFLPDCFGFGYALPAIEAHCGLKGFSSQKLTWGSSVGIPFDIGVWEGVDGSEIVAALNPDPYVDRVRHNLATDERWMKTVEKQGAETGLYVGYKYFGTGDTGGAPDDESVAWVEKSIASNEGLTVISAPADKLYRDLTPAMMRKLPRYNGELLMTTHGTGCYTSQNAMKRWNRKNELLSDAVERASVIADWLGGIEYPRDNIMGNWVRFVWHQFHDDLTGTSIPEAYEFSWNDEIICLNRSAAMLENAVGAVSRALDTDVEGEAVVVYNPIAVARNDIAEADISFPDGVPSNIRVFDAEGKEVLSQVNAVNGEIMSIAFQAHVGPVGFAVYDIRPSDAPCRITSSLSVSRSGITNDRYEVSIDSNGDVSSIRDKKANRELLDAPIRLAMFENESTVWPAWEITYAAVSADPVEYVADPVSVDIVENGPARVALEIARRVGFTTVKQTIRLASGADRIEFDHAIDWRSKNRLLKAVFPLAVASPKATYDLGLGTIQRGNNTEQLYEVPAQQWADITDSSGSYGVSIMNDCLYGWDKPSDNTLRLTMIHTPKPGNYGDQAMQDIGFHRMCFAVMGHEGNWNINSRPVHEASLLNQPLLAFQSPKHGGGMGRSFSFLTVGTDQISVKALKMAEESDEIVVRMVETEGRNIGDAEIAFAFPITGAREINGAEEPVGEAIVRDGKLVTGFSPYQPKTFAVTIGYPDASLSIPRTAPLEFPYDIDVVSLDSDRSDGDMDGEGHTISGDILPETLVCEDIPFAMGSGEKGMMNALVCRGQTIQLPPSPRLTGYNRLYVLAAAVGGDTDGTFTVGDETVSVGVQDYTGFIGQWDNRLVNGQQVKNVFQVTPASIKRDRLAWIGTHRHSRNGGNEAYVFTYLYRYAIDLPPRAREVTLPDNGNIRIFAMTAAVNANDDVRSAQTLYDEATSASVMLDSDSPGYFIGTASVGLTATPEDAVIRYTLDGTEPTESSPRYTGRFSISGDTTIMAKAFAEGYDTRLMVADLKQVTPRPAVNVNGLGKGLSYRLYHGEWDKLPDFKRLKSVKSGTIDRITIPDGTREDNFGILFEGYIDIPAEGIYTFYTMSDDGSRLWIDDEVLVDNDGLHGQQEIEGTVALMAGKHKITVAYFEKGGGQEVSASCSGPGIRKRYIDSDVLWH